MNASVATAPASPELVLRRLEWRVLKRLDGRLQGNFRTLLYGSGIDVADLRDYEPGDDVRHIDWNVTARTDTPHVRTFREDREVTAWLLLDRSPSMAFGREDRSKQRTLVDLSVCLARLLIHGGNPVGFVLFDGQSQRVIPPRNTRAHVLHLAREMLASSAATGSVTDLGHLLEHATRTLRRRSVVIVVSDFITAPDWERPLAMLARRHDVIAVRVFDPRERELPDVGVIVVEDAETGDLLEVDTGDPEFRRRYAAAEAQQRDAVRAGVIAAQADLHDLSTDDDLVDSLVRMIERRKRRR